MSKRKEPAAIDADFCWRHLNSYGSLRDLARLYRVSEAEIGRVVDEYKRMMGLVR